MFTRDCRIRRTRCSKNVSRHSTAEWAEFNSEAYMHTVVPNLVRLGLITERTEHLWREKGMLSDSRAQS